MLRVGDTDLDVLKRFIEKDSDKRIVIVCKSVLDKVRDSVCDRLMEKVVVDELLAVPDTRLVRDPEIDPVGLKANECVASGTRDDENESVAESLRLAVKLVEYTVEYELDSEAEELEVISCVFDDRFEVTLTDNVGVVVENAVGERDPVRKGDREDDTSREGETVTDSEVLPVGDFVSSIEEEKLFIGARDAVGTGVSTSLLRLPVTEGDAVSVEVFKELIVLAPMREKLRLAERDVVADVVELIDREDEVMV